MAQNARRDVIRVIGGYRGAIAPPACRRRQRSVLDIVAFTPGRLFGVRRRARRCPRARRASSRRHLRSRRTSLRNAAGDGQYSRLPLAYTAAYKTT